MPEPREYPGIGVGSTAAVGPCARFAAPPAAKTTSLKSSHEV